MEVTVYYYDNRKKRHQYIPHFAEFLNVTVGGV